MRQLTSADWTMVSLDTADRPQHHRDRRDLRPVHEAGRAADLRRGARVHRGPPARRRELPRAAGPRAVRARPAVVDPGRRLRPRVPRPRDRAARSRGAGGSSARRSPASTPARSTSPGRRGSCTSSTASTASSTCPRARSPRFLRVHHAAIDGVAGAEILTAIHTHEPDGEPPPPAEGYSWEPDPIPSDADLLRRAARQRPHETGRRPARSPDRRSARSPRSGPTTSNADVTSPASLPKAHPLQPAGRAPTGCSARRTRRSTPSSRSARRCPRRRSTTSAWRSSAARSAPTCSTRTSCPTSRCSR